MYYRKKIIILNKTRALKSVKSHPIIHVKHDVYHCTEYQLHLKCCYRRILLFILLYFVGYNLQIKRTNLKL